MDSIKTPRTKWVVRWFDGPREIIGTATTLAKAVHRAKCADEKFRRGRKCDNGAYTCWRSGITIERQ